MHKVKVILFIVFVLAINVAIAGNKLGFDKSLRGEIDKHFMVDGDFSKSKIESYRVNILKRKKELTKLILDYEVKLKKESRTEALAEVSDSDSHFIYNLILESLNKIDNTNDYVTRMKLARDILDWDYASKVSGKGSAIDQISGYIKNFPGSNTLYKGKNTLGEASNLYNQARGEFYSHDELKTLKAQGQDLSLLNPSPESEFWFDRDIESAKPKDVLKGRGSPLYSKLDIKFPKNGGKFKKVRSTQSKPKIDFTYKIKNPVTGKKEKRTFKLKVGSEMHAEISAASLLGSLGFHTDLTRYVRDFKITLPKGMSIEDLKRDWYSYDKFRLFDLDALVKKIGVDEKGRTYLIFIEGLIETKPQDLVRLGPWPFGSLGHQGKREVRGLHLFNLWVANNDIKESDNNKLVLKKNSHGGFDSFKFMHDVGFAFGFLLKETPNSFKWNLIKRNTKNKIDFNYASFQINSGFDHVTFDDAKWMVRKIARLSRKQIKEAIELGGWPKEAGDLLVEKLISRRNDLVKAFELEGEYPEIPFDRYISSKNAKLKNGQITNTKFEGYTQHFGGELATITKPVGDAIERISLEGLRYLSKGLRDFTIGAETVGLDSGVVSEIRLKVEREIISNPKPQGLDDNFIVRDIFKVRYALGAGIIIRGKAAYLQEFTLLYPAKDFRAGAYNNGFIFNALLPKNVRSIKLPEHYILIANHGVEGEGEILFAPQSLSLTPGASAGVAFTKGRLGGYIVSKKPDEYTVFKERSKYNQALAKIYLELLAFRIPLIEAGREKGILFREAYRVALPKDGEERISKLKDLENFIKTGKLKEIKLRGKKTEIQSKYTKKESALKLYFYNRKTEKRVDQIERVMSEEDKVTKDSIYQVDLLRKKSFGVFSPGELKHRRFRFRGEVDDQGGVISPLLDIHLLIEDYRTRTQELADHYIPNINQLALSQNFIKFSPRLYSKNNEWGLNHVSLRMVYDEKALEKLINTPAEVFYDVIAKSSNRDASFWKRRRDRDEKIDHRSLKLRSRYQKFVRAMTKAKNKKIGVEKYNIVVEAFNNIIRSKGDAFDLTLMQRIHKVIGRDNYFFEGHITIPNSQEMRYPEKTPLYNVMNEHLLKKEKFLEFDFKDVLETWELFF